MKAKSSRARPCATLKRLRKKQILEARLSKNSFKASSSPSSLCLSVGTEKCSQHLEECNFLWTNTQNCKPTFMLCYYMYDPLTYKFQSVKDKTDRKIIQILFRVQEEICWIGHYLAIIYVMQRPKMLKTDFFFSRCVYWSRKGYPRFSMHLAQGCCNMRTCDLLGKSYVTPLQQLTK